MSPRRLTIPVPSRRALAGIMEPRPYRELRHRRHARKAFPMFTRALRWGLVLWSVAILALLAEASWLSAFVAAVAGWASGILAVWWLAQVILDEQDWRRVYRARVLPRRRGRRSVAM